MGRSPCCDKVGLKKGPWTPEEDQKLLAYVDEHGHGNWRALPSKAGLQRCGKSCRLRWTNYLRPDIVRGKFSLQEEQTIIQLHALLGNRWSAIATHLPKRTDNEIKNYWNTHLKKRLTKMGIDPVTHKPKNDALVSNVEGADQSKSTANLSHMAQWESARLEAEARLARQSKLKVSSIQTQLDNANFLEYNVNINPHHPPTTSSTSLNNLGSTSSPPPPPPPPTATRCLDHVLRAWQYGAHHSPTSTLSFSENGSAIAVGPTPTATTITTTTTTTTTGEGASTAMIEFMGNNKNNASAEGYDDDGVGMTSLMPTFTSGLHEMSGSSQPAGFIEGFTELLLCNFTERSLSPDEDDGDGDGDGGADVTEDNKSYWNSILNLVNSSPSSSPLF